MKRLLAFALSLALVFVFVACSNKDSDSLSSDPAVSSVSDDTNFIKPQNYASVLLITINPQFKLYLDEQFNVLAVEAVNKDALEVKSDLIFENQKIEKVVENIVSSASKKGFVKNDATIDLEIVEHVVETVNTADILSKATTAAKQVATNLDINIKIESSNTVNTNVSSEVSNISSKETTASEATVNNTVSSVAPQPTHTHTFSVANCIEPKKCSCGITEGNALGHDYKSGICSRCGVKDPNYVISYTNVTQKNGRWSLKYLVGDTLYNVNFRLYNSENGYSVSLGLGDPLSKLPEDFQQDIREQNDGSYVIFNGGEYYIGRGNGDGLASVNENGNTVIITDFDGNSLKLTRTNENTLTVEASPDIFSVIDKIPAGTAITFTAE